MTDESYLITFGNGEGPPLRVGRHQSILDAALDAGVAIGFGCFYGDCTVCASRLISGAVDQSQATGLSPEQRARGLVLLCVATPQSDCHIEIGLGER